jgi:hypothetical protein
LTLAAVVVSLAGSDVFAQRAGRGGFGVRGGAIMGARGRHRLAQGGGFWFPGYYDYGYGYPAAGYYPGFGDPYGVAGGGTDFSGTADPYGVFGGGASSAADPYGVFGGASPGTTGAFGAPYGSPSSFGYLFP